MIPGRRRAQASAIAGVVALGALWVSLEALDGVRWLDLLAGAAAGAAALFLARIREPWNRWAPGTPAERPEVEGSGEADAARLVRAILEALRRRIDARRVVLWRRDPTGARLEPIHTAGPPAPGLSALGQPLLLALGQAQALRVEPRPHWALAGTLALPARPDPDGLILTVERDPPPDPLDVAEAAELAAAAVRLGARDRRAAAVTDRFDRLVEFLGRLSGHDAGPGHFPRELARAAAEIAGAGGALVASWEGESGRVVERYGHGGGPAAGTYFGIMAGDVAMAARAGDTLRRSRAEGRIPPLVEAGERWSRPPEHTAVVPLVDAGGHARGAIGIWAGNALEEEGLSLLRALAPLLALQLEHSLELDQVRESAFTDPLTGLANRAALERDLIEEGKRFHRYRHPYGLIVIDLDHFKRINDTYGHPAGDVVLRRVADIVNATIRDADHAYRFGGEELVVLLPETFRSAAAEVAERVRLAIQNARFQWGGEPLHVTASLGVSACPECTDDPAQLLRSADQALYDAKRSGRNRVTTAGMAPAGG